MRATKRGTVQLKLFAVYRRQKGIALPNTFVQVVENPGNFRKKRTDTEKSVIMNPCSAF